MAIGAGNWNIFGINLPEFGWTEKLPYTNKTSVSNARVRTQMRQGTGPNEIPQPTVLGDSDSDAPNYSTPTSNNTSSGGGSSSSNDIDRDAERLRDEISSNYDRYIRGFDEQLGGLSAQRAAQDSIINNQYNQGVNTLGLQLQQGQDALSADRADVQQNQLRNLRDISSNIRNAFQAGNVYLGARGAGDSSAANQYSYALNKMGTQQRSNVMQDTARILADVDARENELRTTYNTEINNMGLERDSQIQKVAQWFAEAQNELRQMKQQGMFAKGEMLTNLSRDLLNNAIAKVNQIETAALNRKQMLDQWAMGVSENIGQLKSNMNSISDVSYSMPQAQTIAGAPVEYPNGNMATNFRGAGTVRDEDDRQGLFSRWA